MWYGVESQLKNKGKFIPTKIYNKQLLEKEKSNL